MNYYVEIRSKEGSTLFSVATQKCVPTGRLRIGENGENEAEFVPITKGAYTGKFWATRGQIETDRS